uniref:Ig-like domain-containing protein n=1 Tax=Chelydra serpentina TaxID=8475 RepID=A0A8C3SQG5_CHESE
APWTSPLALLHLTAPSPNLPPSGLHSRHLLHTVVSEPGPGLPWYSRVAYVDDQVIFDYTSEKQRVEPRTAWMAQNEGPEFWDHQIFWARHTITGSFTCTSTNVIYAIMCQQCPSAMYIGQTGQSLRKRINGHKSDIRNGSIQKPVGEHFSLPGHTIADLKVAILQQKTSGPDFKEKLPRFSLFAKWHLKTANFNFFFFPVRPTARVHYWSSHDGLTTLSCKVSGFYPRDITVTWLKNGESRQQDTYSEGILPSGDGTYQTWVTIEIDPKIKANYSCHVEHESLLEPLSVSWGKEGSSNLPLISSQNWSCFSFQPILNFSRFSETRLWGPFILAHVARGRGLMLGAACFCAR